MNVPSGYTALDLVGFTDRGTYSNLTNYVKNDLVHYGGDIWKCLLDDTTNKTPAEGTYWTLWIDNNTTADSVSYNNTQSGLSATNVKGAIDEVSSDIATLSNLRAELGAHNLFDLVTQAPTVETLGVTFVTNANKTVTANGQSTASAGSTSRINTIASILKAGSYKFSAGLPATGSDTTYYCFLYDRTNSRRIAVVYGDEDVAFTANSDIEITVYMSVCPGYTANNIVYKPMICDARDTDKAFAPFSKPNTELTKDTKGLTDNQFENGAVNLAEVDANGYTLQGITFIVNADKTISTTGKSTNSTGNKYTSILACSNVANVQENKRYKLSGCPTGGGNALYDILLFCRDSSNAVLTTIQDYGNGVEFTAPSGTVKTEIYVRCYYDVTVTGKVFKPMITVADMPNSDYAHYVPYAKSNKELTRLIKKKTATVTTSSNGNASIATDLVPYSAQILAINVTSGAENGAIAVAYKNLGASVNGLHVWAPDGTSLASTQIGIEVIYIDGADVI